MPETTISEKVSVLVENVAAEWNGGAEVLTRLAAVAGTDHASPYAVFRQSDPDALERLFGDDASRAQLDGAVDQLNRYLAAETWFDRAARDDARLASLRERPVAYFCAEFGIVDWFPIYSGGLGILAGDVLKESSDMGLPFVGIGLFYRHGFFYQQLDQTDYQTEIYPTLNPDDLPLSRTQDSAGKDLVISVPMANRTVYVAVWQLQVGRTTLYLLDTDTPENESTEVRSITAGLYAGNQETRIRQEIVLGIGGVRLLRALGIDPSIYGMNEGHAAFLGLELLAEELETTDFPTAVQRVRNRAVYTNHTVVPAGNDVFPADLVRYYLGAYAVKRNIGVDRLIEIASTGAAEQFSMPMLAFHLSGKANAVSEIHAEAIAREWPGFEVEVVTNGVHSPTWVGQHVSSLLNQYVPDWRGDSPVWERIYSIPPAELWNARAEQRRAMLDFVTRRASGAHLNPDALTIVWARRFAEYKRADLISRDLPRLERIMSNSERPVQLVISGKAHPMDEGGKRMMQRLLTQLEASPVCGSHVAFVPDYSITIAQALTAGADIWLNTPRKYLEASGTSGMKASDNGGIQLTVRDGWAAEVDWWDVGWGIEGGSDEADADQLYHFLEESITPCYYARGESDVPERWINMMKNTMVVTLTRYSARRMVLDYIYKLYLPLVEEQEARAVVPGV